MWVALIYVHVQYWKKKNAADIKIFIEIIDVVWQIRTIYDHLIFGRLSININYYLTASGHDFNKWLTKIIMNDSDSIFLQYCKVTIYNHCIPQFDLFQTLTNAY